jgi:hypothetical protein
MLPSGDNVIKLFTDVIYGFRTKLVFVRLDWKSLPRTNTLAYYKNPLFTDKKSFKTLGPSGRNW